MRTKPNLNRAAALAVCIVAAVTTANAQFKVSAPPPYSDPVARQKIRALLEKVDPGNRQQTLDTISGLLVWYRDIADEELIAAWQKDETRANLAELTKPLADARVASGVVEFSWRQRRQATFNSTYAPVLEELMTRFPDSVAPFLNDLLDAASGQQTLDLSPPEEEAACRILLDLPDIRTFRKSALRILPNHRRVTESLLARDQRSDDLEKRNQAQVWLNDLRFNAQAPVSAQSQRRSSQPALYSREDSPRGVALTPPAGAVDTTPAPRVSATAPSSSAAASPGSTPRPAARVPALIPAEPQAYNGPRSGTLECNGGVIAQNAEYVFRNLPPVKMQLEYDTKIWEAHLAPGEGQTQRLILKNKGSGPQKRCVVHWSVLP